MRPCVIHSWRMSWPGKVMEQVENVTSDVWELEGGVAEEQQELAQIRSVARVHL